MFFAVLLAAAAVSRAQSDEICGDTGGSVWMHTSVVYGRVSLHGFEGQKLPKIVVTVSDQAGKDHWYTVDRSGNYCFRGLNGGGGYITLQVEGVEVARRRLTSTGPPQHREDFAVHANQAAGKGRAPGTISAKYNYPRDGKTATLFENAIAAEQGRKLDVAIKLYKEVVATDPKDFIAWARLGGLYYDKGDFSLAESSLKSSLSLRPDFSVAMMNLGRVHLIQNRVEPAIEILEKAVQEEPGMARAFQLLGESYLLARKGTLGVQALNEAIRLDPIGMAVCHLLIARLYDLAGIKHLASREYRLFLEKVPNHPDKKKFEKYVRDNPEDAANN